MNQLIEVMSAVAALAGSGVLFAGLKVRGSSVLLHHATHGLGFANKRLNRLAGEWAGIVTLSGAGFDEYRRVHSRHHAHASFAQRGLDEEAEGLFELGFQPGRSQRTLWRTFWLTQVNPVWHAQQSWARLRSNFFDGPVLRRVAAWALWGGAGTSAAAAGWLPGFLGGVVAPLLLVGNIASYWELTSRHIWMVTSAHEGRARQLDLSHGRLMVPMPPAHWGLKSTFNFIASVAAKAVARWAVVPADLAFHFAHHAGWDRRPHGAPPAWADAALAYSDQLRADPEIATQIHTSLRAALGAWFARLEKEAPVPASARLG